jgi:hypothetical protein
MKAKKFVCGRPLSFVSYSPEGDVQVVTLSPGDALIVQPEQFKVEDMPADADALEVAPEVAPEALPLEPAPVVEPEAVPAVASARRMLRPAVASQARQSIRQRVMDFRASAMRGSVARR